jgi:hypothetical protein
MRKAPVAMAGHLEMAGVQPRPPTYRAKRRRTPEVWTSSGLPTPPLSVLPSSPLGERRSFSLRLYPHSSVRAQTQYRRFDVHTWIYVSPCTAVVVTQSTQRSPLPRYYRIHSKNNIIRRLV